MRADGLRARSMNDLTFETTNDLVHELKQRASVGVFCVLAGNGEAAKIVGPTPLVPTQILVRCATDQPTREEYLRCVKKSFECLVLSFIEDFGTLPECMSQPPD